MARAATRTPQRVRPPDVRRGDLVLVLTGKDGGKRGTVERVVEGRKVVVEGLNLAKRHTKPRQRQNSAARMPQVQQGGILEIAQPIAISNVMIVCPSCQQPTRVGHATAADGRSVRVCRHCGEALTRPEAARG